MIHPDLDAKFGFCQQCGVKLEPAVWRGGVIRKFCNYKCKAKYLWGKYEEGEVPKCRFCSTTLVIGTNWLDSQKIANNRVCDECRRDKGKELAATYHANNPKKIAEYRRTHKKYIADYQRARNMGLWDEVFAHYGDACINCGEKGRLFLTIDHKDNNGSEVRRLVHGGSVWVAKKTGWPDNLQILCWNCQFAKALRLEREEAIKAQSLKFEGVERWVAGVKLGYCFGCRVRLTAETSSPSQVKHKYGLCRVCRSKHEVKMRDRYKSMVMAHYGGKCYCCGEIQIDKLTIGHPNEDGYIQRKELGVFGGSEFYRWLVLHDFKTNYELRVECYNCNCGANRTSDGLCPHKKPGFTIIPTTPPSI